MQDPSMLVRLNPVILGQSEMRSDPAPEELRRVRELLECLNDNAQRIAESLGPARPRSDYSSGPGTSAMLLREQQQHLKKAYFRRCSPYRSSLLVRHADIDTVSYDTVMDWMATPAEPCKVLADKMGPVSSPSESTGS